MSQKSVWHGICEELRQASDYAVDAVCEARVAGASGVAAHRRASRRKAAAFAAVLAMRPTGENSRLEKRGAVDVLRSCQGVHRCEEVCAGMPHELRRCGSGWAMLLVPKQFDGFA